MKGFESPPVKYTDTYSYTGFQELTHFEVVDQFY
jgi:hypothetical protein